MIEYYKSRYRRNSIRKKWHLFLIDFLKLISKTKLVDKLSLLDKLQITTLDRTKSFNEYFLEHSENKISLYRIEFIEAIELDNIEFAEKQIYKIIRKNKFYTHFGKGKNLPASKVSEIKQRLSEFKTSFKTWSTGNLFELSNEKPTKNNDLFEYVSFEYFKSYDNLLILKLDVKPSSLFFKELKSIIKNKTIPTDIPTISHFKDFIKTKRIIKGFRATGNLKEKGFNNLIYDLNFQLKKNFLLGLEGVFSKKKHTNPFIAYFNSKSKFNYKDLNQGFGIINNSDLSDIFYDQKKGYYMLNYWNSRIKNSGLYVLGENNAFPKKYDSDKNLEKYVFSSSIYKSWAIIHYLRALNKELNGFRKKVYSFINSKGRIKFKEQIRIKSDLSKKKIRFQRLQREFNNRNIENYLNSTDYNLNKLGAINYRWGRNPTYNSFIKSQIKYYIKDDDEQISDLDKYFKEISSINLIKLNYKFQVVATILTILGLIFAIANAEDIFNLIKKIIE